MSKVVPLRKGQATFSYRDGYVLLTDEWGALQKTGPFVSGGAAKEWAINAARNCLCPWQHRCNIAIDWDSFPYTPDPRNGEVWVTEGGGARCRYVNGEWVETPCGFYVIHMSSGGGSAGGEGGFATLEEARAAAVRIARERDAVLS
jgi:hypothetical protein